MGVGRNMAYRKETFIREKGFSKSLNLQSGDDDLFVNGIANEYNTRVEISSESVTWSLPKDSFNAWFRQKERHLSTAKYYTLSSLMLIGMELFSRAMFYLLVVAILIFSPLPLKIAVMVLFVLRYGVQLRTINKVAKQWNERRFYLLILFFDLFLPLVNLYVYLFRKKTIYHWK
jgi:hypothetical protein